MEPEQIFLSHTRQDIEFVNIVSRSCTDAGLFPYRAEFNDLERPEWKSIKKEMQKSCALILVGGRKLVDSQNKHDNSWHYTQNWIAYEIGLAHQLGIDVWVVCDNLDINFPVPYLNNYFVNNLKNAEIYRYFVDKLKFYVDYPRQPFPLISGTKRYLMECPYCGNVYNLHLDVKESETIICPTCLQKIEFPKGFPELK